MPGQLKYPILVQSIIEKKEKIQVAKWDTPKKEKQLIYDTNLLTSRLNLRVKFFESFFLQKLKKCKPT